MLFYFFVISVAKIVLTVFNIGSDKAKTMVLQQLISLEINLISKRLMMFKKLAKIRDVFILKLVLKQGMVLSN